MTAWYEWLLIVLLVSLSGLFSGLNLGLMGLNPLELELKNVSPPSDRYARAIKPLRKRGNWLLCTLLLGNVAVNAYLSILMAEITSGTVGFLVSTCLIVVFGEIIPQAICSRYALVVGAKTIYFSWFVFVLLTPLSWPVSKVLDYLLGDELVQVYSNVELQKLVQMHADQEEVTGVDDRTVKVFQGVSDLKTKKVSAIMTKWKDVFSLKSNDRLTFDTLTEIFKKGHSRIPVVSPKKNEDVEGILYVKDLILLDPDDEMPASRIMQAFHHEEPPYIEIDDTLEQCLKVFIEKKQHLAVVRKIEHHNTKDSVIKICGIITMEDVIEHVLQVELVDEHDEYHDRKRQKKTDRLQKIDWNLLKIFDHRNLRLTNLPPQELQAVYHFLCQSIRVFFPTSRLVSEPSIKNLLMCSKVVRVVIDDNNIFSKPNQNNNSNNNNISSQNNYNNNYDNGSKHDNLNINIKRTQRDPYRDIEDNGLLLYQRDKKTEYFTLLLDGRCEIFAGKQGFRSELHRWSYLCPEALERVQQCHIENKPMIDYVADFTCKIVETSRVLRISLNDWKACLEGKFEKSIPNNIDVKDNFPNKAKSSPMVIQNAPYISHLSGLSESNIVNVTSTPNEHNINPNFQNSHFNAPRFYSYTDLNVNHPNGMIYKQPSYVYENPQNQIINQRNEVRIPHSHHHQQHQQLQHQQQSNNVEQRKSSISLVSDKTSDKNSNFDQKESEDVQKRSTNTGSIKLNKMESLPSDDNEPVVTKFPIHNHDKNMSTGKISESIPLPTRIHTSYSPQLSPRQISGHEVPIMYHHSPIPPQQYPYQSHQYIPHHNQLYYQHQFLTPNSTYYSKGQYSPYIPVYGPNDPRYEQSNNYSYQNNHQHKNETNEQNTNIQRTHSNDNKSNLPNDSNSDSKSELKKHKNDNNNYRTEDEINSKEQIKSSTNDNIDVHNLNPETKQPILNETKTSNNQLTIQVETPN